MEKRALVHKTANKSDLTNISSFLRDTDYYWQIYNNSHEQKLCRIHGTVTHNIPRNICILCERDQRDKENKWIEDRDKRNKFYEQSNLKKQYSHFKIEEFKFDKNNIEDIKAHDHVKRFIIQNESFNFNALFLGSGGNGKTTMSQIVANHYIKNLRQALYIKYYQLDYNNLKFDEINITQIKKSPFLIIDEIFSTNVYQGKEILHNIIDTRYYENLPTILIANKTEAEFKKEINEMHISLWTKIREKMYSGKSIFCFSGKNRRI